VQKHSKYKYTHYQNTPAILNTTAYYKTNVIMGRN